MQISLIAVLAFLAGEPAAETLWGFDDSIEEWVCEAGVCHWDPMGVSAGSGSLFIEPFISPQPELAASSAVSPCTVLPPGSRTVLFEATVEEQSPLGFATLELELFEDASCAEPVAAFSSRIEESASWVLHAASAGRTIGPGWARLRVGFFSPLSGNLAVRVDNARLTAVTPVPSLDTMGTILLAFVLLGVAVYRVRRLTTEA